MGMKLVPYLRHDEDLYENVGCEDVGQEYVRHEDVGLLMLLESDDTAHVA